MKKLTLINQYELPITVVRDGDGYVATCSKWKDCYAQGDTVDEVVSEITSVAASLVELYEEEGLKVPLEIKKKSNFSGKLSFEVPLVVAS